MMSASDKLWHLKHFAQTHPEASVADFALYIASLK